MFAATPKTSKSEFELEEAEKLAVEKLEIKTETYIKWKQNTEQQALDLEAKLTLLEKRFPNPSKIPHEITQAKKTLQKRADYNAQIQLKNLEEQMRIALHQAADAGYTYEISSTLSSLFSPQKFEKTFDNIRKFNVAFDEIAFIEGVEEKAEMKKIPIEEGKLSPGMRFTLYELFDYTKAKLDTNEYSALFPKSTIAFNSMELTAKYRDKIKAFFETILPNQLQEAVKLIAFYEKELARSALPPRHPHHPPKQMAMR